MKGTRLWQDTGSPLISGRSRRVRSVSADLWSAVIASAVGWAAGVTALWFAQGGEASASDLGLVITQMAPGGVVGALLGSLFGIGVGRSWGVRRPWVIGAAVGLVVALLIGYLTLPVFERLV